MKADNDKNTLETIAVKKSSCFLTKTKFNPIAIETKIALNNRTLNSPMPNIADQTHKQ